MYTKVLDRNERQGRDRQSRPDCARVCRGGVSSTDRRARSEAGGAVLRPAIASEDGIGGNVVGVAGIFTKTPYYSDRRFAVGSADYAVTIEPADAMRDCRVLNAACCGETVEAGASGDVAMEMGAARSSAVGHPGVTGEAIYYADV